MKFWFRIYIYIWLPILAISLALFQNCAPNGSPQNGASTKALDSLSNSPNGSKNPLSHLANGDGYAKGIYMNIASVNASCPDGVKAIIVKDGDHYEQTKKDCKPLSPALDVTEQIEIMEHNPLVLFTTDALFEVRPVATSAPSEIVCRGVASKTYKGKLPYADISLLPSGKKTSAGRRIMSGYIITGNYSNNQLVDRETIRLLNVVEEASPEGIYSYSLKHETSTSASNYVAQGLEVYKAKAGLVIVDKPTGETLLVNDMTCKGHTPQTTPSLGGTSTQTAAATADKTKCVFTLKGEKGFEWTVERYVDHGTSCSEAEAIVKANNPKATITPASSNYVHDPIGDKPKVKCTFTLEGQKGFRWTVERYIDAGKSCSSEVATVQANNPNAKIVGSGSTQVNTVVTAPSKVVCTYVLRGQKGFEWTVERQLPAGGSCSAEAATVRANNPNATIVSTTQKTVSG